MVVFKGKITEGRKEKPSRERKYMGKKRERELPRVRRREKKPKKRFRDQEKREIEDRERMRYCLFSISRKNLTTYCYWTVVS